MNQQQLQEKLCQQLCADIKLVERQNGKKMISSPFFYPDGDRYSIYLQETGTGKVRISDEANTMMRLSYYTPDVDKYFKGSKGKLMGQILGEHKINEDNGNFYVDVSVEQMARGIFNLSQALGQIYDLSYLNRDRLASTFYKDLKELLEQIVSDKPAIKLEQDYRVPDLENSDNYRIDYSLQGSQEKPLFLFGVPNQDKAKLVTITLQYLFIHKVPKSTLLVFENSEDISPKHLGRLMDANIAGSQVSSISSREPIEQNITSLLEAA